MMSYFFLLMCSSGLVHRSTLYKCLQYQMYGATEHTPMLPALEGTKGQLLVDEYIMYSVTLR